MKRIFCGAAMALFMAACATSPKYGGAAAVDIRNPASLMQAVFVDHASSPDTYLSSGDWDLEATIPLTSGSLKTELQDFVRDRKVFLARYESSTFPSSSYEKYLASNCNDPITTCPRIPHSAQLRQMKNTPEAMVYRVTYSLFEDPGPYTSKLMVTLAPQSKGWTIQDIRYVRGPLSGPQGKPSASAMLSQRRQWLHEASLWAAAHSGEVRS